MDSMSESMEHEPAEVSYKIVVLGPSGVGKTSIVMRYSAGLFSDNTTMTVGAGYVKCEVDLPEDTVVLNVWDTAGQERFSSLIPLYVRSAQGCLLVCDVSQPGEIIKTMEKQYKELTDNIYVLVCLNKIDLGESPDVCNSVMRWCRDKGLKYFKTSAKTGEGIEDVFIEMAGRLKGMEKFTELAGMPIDQIRGRQKKCC